MIKVRYAAELGIDDVVRTPLGRLANVLFHDQGRVVLIYPEGDQVSLRADLLELVSRAPPAALPKDYFSGSKR